MYISVDVNGQDVLDELSDEELLEELERRGKNRKLMSNGLISEFEMLGLLETIWFKRRTGKPFDAEIDKLIYDVLGKVI